MKGKSDEQNWKTHTGNGIGILPGGACAARGDDGAGDGAGGYDKSGAIRGRNKRC